MAVPARRVRAAQGRGHERPEQDVDRGQPLRRAACVGARRGPCSGGPLRGSGEPHAGSFYDRFDHGSAGARATKSGFTEDLLFALLGLVAASRADVDADVSHAVAVARRTLLGRLKALYPAGMARQHLWLPSETRYAFAGEALQTLRQLVMPGDVSLDDQVDLDDFTVLASSWGVPRSVCLCEGDLNDDDRVDTADLLILADNWLLNSENESGV